MKRRVVAACAALLGLLIEPSVTHSCVATRTLRHSSEPVVRCEIAAGTSTISPGTTSTVQPNSARISPLEGLAFLISAIKA